MRTKNTAWIAGTGVLALLVLVATYFLAVAPKRAEAADLATQTAGVRQSNDRLAAETEQLRAQFATLDQRRAELAAIRATLPDSAQVPALLRQFSGYATAAGVSLDSVAPGAPEPFETGAQTGSTGVTAVPVTTTVRGSFAGSELFLKMVQADMQRFFLVQSVSVKRATTTGEVVTTVTGDVFVLQDAHATSATSTGTSTGATAQQGATTSDATASTTETVS
ncbi:type 4a pilus biogenesis protein PilO [Kineococcus sp. SYSU DK005]|uniref:type 4a pilus biogenesis protein PilO n=1 Tax=Kineococcus sp. SYSU DK005 TaxID=3383126 RepID=UPI003D7CB121